MYNLLLPPYGISNTLSDVSFMVFMSLMVGDSNIDSDADEDSNDNDDDDNDDAHDHDHYHDHEHDDYVFSHICWLPFLCNLPECLWCISILF